MSTVPTAAAAVFCGTDPARSRACGGHLVQLGRRVEVDLVALAAADPDLAADLSAWWDRTRALWDAARDGDLTGHAWVRTRRTLLEARQSVSKGAKSDLVAEYDALVAAGPFTGLVHEATAVRPVAAHVRSLAGALGGTFAYRPDDYRGELTVPMAGSLLWPAALGGPCWPGEVARHVTLDLRYAAWRDRRVRRLAAVTVAVDELWADPAA